MCAISTSTTCYILSEIDLCAQPHALNQIQPLEPPCKTAINL